MFIVSNIFATAAVERYTEWKRMKEKAEERDADAVLNLQFMTSMVMSGAVEILAYGTAVRLK